MKRALLAATVIVLGLPAGAHAQSSFVWAGGNDVPNTLINATFDGTNMVYNPEIPTGGTTTGGPTTIAFNQVRTYRGAPSGGCSLIAQTNNGSNNVSIYRVNPAGVITPVSGSPFTVPATLQAVAWAPDGGALYVPLSVTGSSQLVTFTVSCTPGGAVTITNAGTVSLTGFSLLRDAEVIGTGVGSHLCVSGTANNAIGCFAIDPVTRLPSTTPVNTISVGDVRGMRIHNASGCGVAGRGNAPLVQAFRVVGGSLTLANTAAHLSNPRYGAVSFDGTLSAWGTFGDDIALYTIDPVTCNVTQVDTDSLNNPAALIEYVAFDEMNRVYVADALINQIRVFQATAAGFGAPLSTTTTNHPTVNPPGGIDAALTTLVPVELRTFGVE